MRRDSHLQQCLVNTPHLCSHHVQAPKLTHSHLVPVTARPTQALSTCNFASSASSPSQLFNAFPFNTILVLQHTTEKPSYTRIPHSSYISCLQVSSEAPNSVLAQVFRNKCDTPYFFPFKLPVKASKHTSGCCPPPMVWAGTQAQAFRSQAEGHISPSMGEGKQHLPGEAVQEIKGKVWAGGTKHKPYLVVFVRRRALPSGWGTAAIKLLATICRPLQKG